VNNATEKAISQEQNLSRQELLGLALDNLESKSSAPEATLKIKPNLTLGSEYETALFYAD